MAKTVKAIVANRRTVEVDGKTFGPGETVSLPADEVEALRDAGFLADDSQAPSAADDAPSVNTADGPAVLSGG